MVPVNDHISWFGELWKWTSGEMPAFNTSYAPDEKLQRENQSTDFYGKFKAVQDDIRNGKRMIKQEAFMPDLTRYLVNVYDFPAESSTMVLNSEFFAVSRSFFKAARNFDSELTPREIYQAMRNVWIMNGIQLMMELPVALTSPMFAYSLLYPYSDNLLDDPESSTSDKLMFSRRFEDRLRGIPVSLRNRREQKIGELVGMIEKQFCRKNYPEVYDSLLAIHAAQTRSISLQANGDDLSHEQIRHICFDKGGASVLADGYLVAGCLTPSQQRFLFGYGIWLQLADDIQDAAEDEAEQVSTLFSGARNDLDPVESINRTLHFGRALIRDIACFPSPDCQEFGKIMLHALEMMIIQSAGLHPDLLDRNYLKQLERHSPLHFDYIRRMKKKGSSRRLEMATSLMGSIEL